MIKSYSTWIKRNITVRIDCPYSDFWRFLDNNLLWLKECASSTSHPCDIRIRLRRQPVLDSSFIGTMTRNYERIGYNLYVKDSSVICILGRWLLWKYEVCEDDNVQVDIYYVNQNDNYLKAIGKRILGRVPARETNRERLLYITRIGIHFPLFLLLRTEADIRIMHAAAVAREGKSVILAGYDGVGKSTLALYLCINCGFQYVADNFLLYDDTYVYPFAESARMNEDSLCALSLPFTGNRIHGRVEFVPPLFVKDARLNISAVFFNSISNTDSIEAISKEQMKRYIMAMEDYLPEFIDYKYFLSVVSFVRDLGYKSHESCLDGFLDRGRLYSLKKAGLTNMALMAGKVEKCIGL